MESSYSSTYPILIVKAPADLGRDSLARLPFHFRPPWSTYLMQPNLTTKRVLIFLAVSFGIPWLAALVGLLAGWIVYPPVSAGTLSALSVLNTIFICSPALGNLAARWLTREGWGNNWLRPNFRRGWRFYLAAWLLPALAVVVGGTVYYLLFPGNFDPSLGPLQEMVAAQAPGVAVDPMVVLFTVAVQGLIFGLTVNALASLGEEFGWRAYLLQKLAARFSGGETGEGNFTPSGVRKAALLTGLIWGVWHWPLITLGTNYNPSHAGAIFLVPLVYLVFTTSLSVLMAWVTLRSGSVLPAAVAHGTVNGTAGLAGYFAGGSPHPAFGPAPTGLIGGLGYLALALVVFFHRKGLAAGSQPAQPDIPAGHPALSEPQ
jgi:membrane protease YdiL (CAAX protease family)